MSVILATTNPFEAYGERMRLHPSVLQQLADAVASGSIPMNAHHDPTQQWEVVNVDAGVREGPDGEFEAWAEFDVDESLADEFEEQLHAAGAPGGMSFSWSDEYGVFEEAPADAPTIAIHADRFHFSDEDLVQAGAILAPHARVSVNHYYQFAAEPLARVILEYTFVALQALPPGLLTNYLYDCIKSFLRLPSRRTVFSVRVRETATERVVEAHLATDSSAVAERAIAEFAEVAKGQGRFEYDVSDGVWRQIE